VRLATGQASVTDGHRPGSASRGDDVHRDSFMVNGG
jgi:hypothetical protein